MRVLQIIESAAAGSGHQVLISSRALSRRGIEVAIVHSNIRVDERFLSTLADLIKEFPETQVKALAMRRLPHPADIRTILALRRFMRESGPFDVIYSHSTKAGLLARIAFPLSRRLHAYSPHAFLTMNTLLPRPLRTLLEAYEKLMSALTATVIAVSSEEQDHALRIGIKKEKIEFVPNGISLETANSISRLAERARYRAALGLDGEQVCVGFLGRLAPQKDLATLLKAFAAVGKAARKEPILAIAGSGPEEPMLKRLAQDLGIEQSVRWAGAVDGPKIAAAFDIFAMSSLYEGLSNSLLEAMTLHLPCVVTNTGGAKELVHAGVNGFIVPVSDPTRLAKALSILVENDGLRKQFGRASAEIVTQYDIAQTSEVMLNVLKARYGKTVPKPRTPTAGAGAGSTAPLRILQLVEAAATGVGRHVADLTEELIARGHDVHLIYSSTNADARFAAAIRQLAPRCKATPMTMRHGLHVADAALIRNLRTYLHKAGPFDIVHCHSSKAGLVGRLAALGAGVPTVYTPHALFTLNPNTWPITRGLAKFVEVTLARHTARLIAVSATEYDHARHLGIPASRLAIVANGTRTRPESAAPAPRPNQGMVRIGCIGRLVPQKAVDHLLRAFALLEPKPNEGTRPILVIAGDGPLAEPLRAQCHSLGLDEAVKWLGDVNGEEVLRQIDLLAVPSDYEGFPYVMLEALAASLPIVSTDVGGATELVHSGVNGYVVPRRDAPALARALTALVASPELRTRMGKASLTIGQEFTIERMVNETIALYRAAIEESPGMQESPSFGKDERLRHTPR